MLETFELSPWPSLVTLNSHCLFSKTLLLLGKELTNSLQRSQGLLRDVGPGSVELTILYSIPMDAASAMLGPQGRA